MKNYFSIISLMFTTGCDSNLDSVYTTEESAKVSQKLATYSVDSNQFDYYWYQGEKIFLKQKATKQYVLFDAEKKLLWQRLQEWLMITHTRQILN